MLLIPLVMVLFPSDTAKIGGPAVLGILMFYGLAKISETYDPEIFHLLGGLISGHTLKHIFAGMSPVVLMMKLNP